MTTQVDLSAMFPRCERAIGTFSHLNKNEVIVTGIAGTRLAFCMTISINHMADSLEKLRRAQSEIS